MQSADVSTLRPGETLVLFPTTAALSEDGREWIVPLHAWVYRPQTSRVRRAAIAELLELRYGLKTTPATAADFDARVNLLLADNKRGRTVVVEIAGMRATLPPTGPNGHARAEIRLPATPGSARDADPATLDAAVQVRAVLPAGDAREFTTPVPLIGPAGLSIISDIDDTVKITHVLDRRRMWEATFYQPFEPVAGMAEAYRRLRPPGGAIHYVSSSPWHLTAPLLQFLNSNGFPVSSIDLKQVRLKDRTALDIVRPGRETKPPAIEAILQRYPGRRFHLIGDSGEDDPEVYAEALRRHPRQIERIQIRNITGARRDDGRFSRVFAGIAAQTWTLFESAEEIGRR